MFIEMNREVLIIERIRNKLVVIRNCDSEVSGRPTSTFSRISLNVVGEVSAYEINYVNTLTFIKVNGTLSLDKEEINRV